MYPGVTPYSSMNCIMMVLRTDKKEDLHFKSSFYMSIV